MPESRREQRVLLVQQENRLLQKLVAVPDAYIVHHANGKPYWENQYATHHLSISHTNQFLAMLVAPIPICVAVDMEPISLQAYRVLTKFVCSEEWNHAEKWLQESINGRVGGQDVVQAQEGDLFWRGQTEEDLNNSEEWGQAMLATLLWSVKEVAYKLFNPKDQSLLNNFRVILPSAQQMHDKNYPPVCWGNKISTSHQTIWVEVVLLASQEIETNRGVEKLPEGFRLPICCFYSLVQGHWVCCTIFNPHREIEF